MKYAGMEQFLQDYCSSVKGQTRIYWLISTLSAEQFLTAPKILVGEAI